MKIGIDISQIAHERTGVANYVKNLVENLLKVDQENEYVLFYSSLRKKFLISNFEFLNGSTSSPSRARSRDKSQILNPNIKIRTFRFPPTFLDFLWNRLHICPIEWFIGDVDVFVTSDWVEPPTIKARKITTIHDLIALKYSEETHPRTEFKFKNFIISSNIVEVQKRRLAWVKKEASLIICDSHATKRDVSKILGIKEDRLRVIYPGGVS